MVNSIKGKLNSICVNRALSVAGAGYSIPFEEQQRIQQILSETAAKMKISDKAGCHYLEALNSFMAPLFFTHNAN
ncbi:hypothetical protein [Mucilaginibacter celer]|uniref:hypothetical protein n=1 Tax=Mucilaginibacter celer TaxID=2305508 RepID=UPI0013CF0A95|nr:hypothetical protein [Mucilaginibacter celer]